MMFRLLFFFTFSAFGLFGLAYSASALTVAPVRQTIVVDPGTETSVSLFLVNDTDAPMKLLPLVESFSLENTTGKTLLGTPEDALSWISPNQESLTLSPGRHGEFTFSLRIPEDTPPGGHYIVLFAQEVHGSGQVGLGARVGSLLFLHVSGTIQELAQVISFSSFKKIYIHAPPTISFALKNAGNIHITPIGEITFSTFWGNTFHTIPLTANRKILAGGAWEETVVVSNIPFWVVGKVRATLTATYGATEQPLAQEVSFWVVSWQMMLVLFFICTSGGVFFVRMFHKKKKKNKFIV
ncbi:MAG: hypothetical protein KBD15_02930 [Candidatus Magasanikbacteria bacterium]|nr:hypothetical protein [Candidatus Magasanikbacteria bacterium]